MKSQQRRPLAPHPLWRWPLGSVLLGYSAKGKPIFVPADMRALGTVITGPSGQGKSRLAEAMLRQDCLELDGIPRGALLLDPHGTLFTGFLAWYVSHGLRRVRPIRILDPSDPRHVFHLNPLRRRPGVDPAVVAAAVTNAVLKVWGGEDATATPQLRETLKAVFYTLCELGLPLTSASDLLDLTDASGLRSYAAEHSRSPVIRQFWRTLDALPIARREELTGSARRRLNEFLLPDRVRAIFSEPERAVDWRQIMDDGELAVVNLSYDRGHLSEDEAQVIGVMILAEIFLSCLGRPEDALPFYIYIDECHRFLTEDTAKLFTEGRKFKTHAVLLHQVLAQLREAGDFVFSAVMAARTKVVFGGLEPDDAEFMARSVFRGQFDFEHRDKVSFRKPVVVGQELDWLLSQSETEGTARATGSNWSRGGGEAHSTSTTTSHSETISDAYSTSESHTNSESGGSSEGNSSSASSGRSGGSAQAYDAGGMPVGGPTLSDGWAQSGGSGSNRSTNSGWGSTDTSGSSETHSETFSDSTAETTGATHSTNWSKGGSTTDTQSRATTHGRSQTLRSVFQILPSVPYSLDELVHLASVKLANLRQGECIVKIGRRPSTRIKTLRVADGWARPEHVARVTAELAATTPYITPVCAFR